MRAIVLPPIRRIPENILELLSYSLQTHDK